jgi:biotin carboxyl carrier protein
LELIFRRKLDMKSYTITVNGNVYDVTVEERVGGAAPVATPVRPAAVVPAAAPVAAPAASAAPTPAAPAVSGTQGSVKITAGAAGKVFKLEASVGQSVKAGDPVIIIEAMKMEIPVVAPQDGTVASIDVAVGDAVEAGAVLATLN